jgi:hypothetical protein
MGFEEIPVRQNAADDIDASWFNTIRTYLINIFPGVQTGGAPFTLANNQSSLADITGLLLDKDTYTFYRISYRAQRSDATPSSHYEVGELVAWWDGSQWNYKRSVKIGNALGDGAGSMAGDYQVGGADSLQINSSSGQGQYLTGNMAGGSYAGTFDWRILEAWGA